MVAGWLQPINAILRPHAPDRKNGEVKTTLRLVWEIAHKALGYVTAFCAIVNIFFGFKLGETFNVFNQEGTGADSWRSGYIAVLAVIVAFAVLGFIFTLLKGRKSAPPAKQVDSPPLGSDQELQNPLQQQQQANAGVAHV